MRYRLEAASEEQCQRPCGAIPSGHRDRPSLLDLLLPTESRIVARKVWILVRAAATMWLEVPMTEAEWNTCTDPQPMLEFLRGKVNFHGHPASPR